MSRHRRRLATVLLVALLVVASAAFTPSRHIIVGVDPLLGRHVARVKVLMTRDEYATVRRMERVIAESSVDVPSAAGSAVWMVEATASGSKTLAYSRAVLRQAQRLLEQMGLVRSTPTYIVVARTQRFINDTLASLDCYPNLVRTGGVHLMGETICDRRVIVVNLTGYFFLRSVDDELTSRMEVLPEPTFGRLNYRIADRNVSGLAHEWAHIARASATGGVVAPDEPAWMREGFAEVLAGIARVKEFSPRMSYATFHVVRLRKFADWGSFCTAPLRRYRSDSDYFAGCEYYLGALAVEYLIARMGGLAALVTLFRDGSRLMDFPAAFRRTYGVTLDAFEHRMDRYLRAIADLPDI